MKLNDTIVAQSTPQGKGAIAIIRLSGKDSIKIVNSLFPSKDLTKVDTHTIHYGNIEYKDSIIDEVLVSVFKEPNSYTKENIVEISCHGADFIIKKILSLTIKLGARVADKGEFTFRSFLSGNMDLSQAEAVSDLISSNSENSHKIAINHIKGVFSNKIKKLRKDLINLSSLLELELDFSEEDVEFANRNQLEKLLNEILSFNNVLLESYKLNNVIKDGINVLILGKPNVGKSTILNGLIEEDKAIISDIPGTTRDVLDDTITVGGNLLRFIDTAGIRETEDKIEQIGIKKALNQVDNASLILYVIDLNNTDLKSLTSESNSKFLKNKNVIYVGNKSDLKIEKEVNSYFKKNDLLMISANKSNDLSNLKDKIDLFISRNLVNEESSIMINERHFTSLTNVNESINNVKKNLNNKSNTDLLAMDIKYALNHLGEITGEVTNDEILGNIFSKFCIGK
ncbi:MAG: tRNA uridine-5-carboxymethylaminomethyl(34) synthesis GTPase MnmE [Cytophagales bacterium]|nr:MAG: tRNA uridine-5-carboxymethylaminomethyl(34) synthesis GTPase MnmE [Rhodothermaeota bacterium MED-G19]